MKVIEKRISIPEYLK